MTGTMLRAWVSPWCRAHLGAEPVPVQVLHASERVSVVLGPRLADGREVAVKARADARAEVLHDLRPVALGAVAAQAEERLRRAGA